MKKSFIFIILLISGSALFGQGIAEKSYNYIFNLGDYSPMEIQFEQKGDEVDKLFDDIGLTSADSRKADIKLGMLFENNDVQTFRLKKLESDGYYVIVNDYSDKVLTVQDASNGEDVNVIPAEWTGADNQKFEIKRDTAQYRYGAYIIAKHSGKALGINDKKSVVQKSWKEGDEKQVWCFSNRIALKNDKGFLGLKSFTMFNELAAISDKQNTISWNYIAHPEEPHYFYIMNSNTRRFLMMEKPWDKENPEPVYNMVQASYKKGRPNYMLFLIHDADDNPERLNIGIHFAKYYLDVDPGTNQIIAVPLDQKSEMAYWDLYNAPRGF